MPTPNIDPRVWLHRGQSAAKDVELLTIKRNGEIIRESLQRVYDGPILNPLRSAFGATK